MVQNPRRNPFIPIYSLTLKVRGKINDEEVVAVDFCNFHTGRRGRRPLRIEINVILTYYGQCNDSLSPDSHQ